jgi:RNA polymerase sigma-70 factor (ECF subfamily)
MCGTAGGGRETILERAAAGDSAAQAELLEHYRKRLRHMIGLRLDKRIAARVDPSDITQEALKTAHCRLPEYFANPQISFYPWLRRIATDRMADAYRTHVAAERRSVLKEHVWKPDLNDESVAELAQSIVTSSIGPDEQALEQERHQQVVVALGQLKPPDREILVLRYLEQLGVREIADVLEISETAVTSRHLRALQRLRRLLER